MTVLSKVKEIAILRSIGYSRRDISAIFLWQGALAQLAGTRGVEPAASSHPEGLDRDHGFPDHCPLYISDAADDSSRRALES